MSFFAMFGLVMAFLIFIGLAARISERWGSKGCVPLFIVLIAVVGFVIVRNHRQVKRYETLFAPEITAYLKLAAEIPRPQAGPEASSEYVSGKIILIDRKEGQIAFYQRSLPKSLKALGPAEAGTLVLLTESEETIGDYRGASSDVSIKARRRLCLVEAIDLKSRAWIFLREFKGSMPKKTLTAGGSAVGSNPWKQVKKHLANLPRKPIT
jgi:hypothetical protein